MLVLQLAQMGVAKAVAKAELSAGVASANNICARYAARWLMALAE